MNKDRLNELVLEGEEDLISLGIPMRLNGFRYLCDAISLGLEHEDMLSILSKGLYQKIADKEHVTPGSVETGIRRAIDVAWRSGRMQTVLPQLTGGVYDHKPTNGEFLSLIVWRLKKKYNIPQFGFAKTHPLLRSVAGTSFVAQNETCYNNQTEEAQTNGDHGEGNTEN